MDDIANDLVYSMNLNGVPFLDLDPLKSPSNLNYADELSYEIQEIPESVINHETSENHEISQIPYSRYMDSEPLADCRLDSEICSPDEEIFICSLCGVELTEKRTLRRHIFHVHSDVTLVFTCNLCGLKFRYRHSLNRHVRIKHTNKYTFKCTKCDAVFRSKREVREHSETIHRRKQFVCQICHKVFRYSNNLSRHKTTVHSDSKRKDDQSCKCPVCESKFVRPDILKRHIKSMHVNLPQYKCNFCGVDLKYRTSLKRHIQNVHLLMECATCHKKFSKKTDLRWHVKREHLDNSSKYGVSCVLCHAAFSNRSRTIQHMVDYHEVHIECENLEMSVSEFHEWKKNIEKSAICQFVRTHITRTRNYTDTTYTCHRSGIITGKTKNLRRPKINGSKKLGGLCPAQMRVRVIKNDNNCTVKFVKTHVGHSTDDEKELGYVFLSREEREKVASQIAAGVPFECILNDTATSEPGMSRLRLINRQDLLNISLAHKLKHTFRSNRVEHPEEVEAFVNEFADSILYYKKPGEVADTQHQQLNGDDFVIVIMTNFQKEMLENYGDDVVTVDGAHVTNGCQYVLQSMLVLDEYREAFPAAFAISNRKDEILLDVFLSCVREKVGVLRPHTLITNVQESSYESWRRIMDTPKQRLYCTWHVNQAWLEQLKLVTNKEKQYKLKKKLYDLRLETYQVPFTEKLEAFLADADEETRRFVDYFEKQFAHTVKYWANCYRTCRVESFDAVVRYLHGEEKKLNTLPLMLKALKKYLQRREVDCQIKKIRGKLTPKLKRLRNRHDLIEKSKNFVVVEKSKPDEWMVSSFSGQDDVAELYAVQRVERQCVECTLYCEKCDICFHEYRCTCSDSLNKANMCVHIHGLGLFLKSSDSSVCVDSVLNQPDGGDSDYVIPMAEPTVIKVDINSPTTLVSVVDSDLSVPLVTSGDRGSLDSAELHRAEEIPPELESDVQSNDDGSILSDALLQSEGINSATENWYFGLEDCSVLVTLAANANSEATLVPTSSPSDPNVTLNPVSASWYLSSECNPDHSTSAVQRSLVTQAIPHSLSDEFELGKDNSQESILVNSLDSPWCLDADCDSVYSSSVPVPTFMEEIVDSTSDLLKEDMEQFRETW